MKTYEIHLIRHGMTAENKQGLYIGSTDVPLSPEGISLLEQYDSEYKYPGTPVVFSSPMLRCVQSCNALYPAMKPLIIDDLRECDFGDWEGKHAYELKNDPAFTAWLADSVNNTPPNGESSAEFTRRVCLAFEKIVNGLFKSGITCAVIVTHGGVISTLMSVYALPSAPSYEWQANNGFGFSLRANSMLWMRDKVLEAYQRIPLKK